MSVEVQYGPPDKDGNRWKPTPPEMELQWAEQDYRIAVDNLEAAEHRHSAALEEYQDALDTLAKARRAVRNRLT